MRFDPTQVPTFPVEIDQSHPLAQGLRGFWLPGLPPPRDLTGRYPSQGLMTIAGVTYYPQIGGTAIGPAYYSPSDNSPCAWVVNNGPILGGLPSFSILAICQTTVNSNNVGLDMYSERALSGNDLIQFTLSYNYNVGVSYGAGISYRDDSGNLTYVSSNNAINDGKLHYIGATISVDDSSSSVTWQIYVDGLLDGSGSTTGTTSFTNSGILSSISGDTQATTAAGYNAAFEGYIPAVGTYAGILPPEAFALWRSEPFAMLRPVRRRTYFVPASTPASTFGAKMAATSAMSVGWAAVGTISAAPAATSQMTASPKGIGTLGSSLAAASTLTASPKGIGTIRSSLAASSQSSGTTAGAGRLAADIAAASALSASMRAYGTIRATMQSASEISSEWSVAGGFGASMDAASSLSATFVGTFPILPGRSIILPPSVRFIVAPVPLPAPILQFRLPTFSPRAPNDVDFFTVDLVASFNAGDSFVGLPAITVPTGDLTIGAPSISGTQVTFSVSGAGTVGSYSQIAIAWQTTSGVFSQTFQVLTLSFAASVPLNTPTGIVLQTPFFGSRAAGDSSYYQLDMSGLVPEGAIITSASVSCVTGDMNIGAVIWSPTSVSWNASGTGTPGAASGFAVQVTISDGATLTIFAAVQTLGAP